MTAEQKRSKVGDIFYRYRDYCGTIYEDTYKVSRATPGGVWLKEECVFGAPYNFPEKGKFVLNDDGRGKRFAYSTKAAAQASFKARKRSQIKILEGQLERAKMVLRKANAGEWFNTLLKAFDAFDLDRLT